MHNSRFKLDATTSIVTAPTGKSHYRQARKYQEAENRRHRTMRSMTEPFRHILPSEEPHSSSCSPTGTVPKLSKDEIDMDYDSSSFETTLTRHLQMANPLYTDLSKSFVGLRKHMVVHY